MFKFPNKTWIQKQHPNTKKQKIHKHEMNQQTITELAKHQSRKNTRQRRMSVRQSLYGQSLVRNANALNFNNDSSQEKHWKRDWYSPSKNIPQSTSITPSATPTPFGDERDTPSLEQQTFNFKVKAWTYDNDYKPIVDGEEEDLLDLEEFSIERKRDANGLTDDAIRGAVGSGESIPGISNGNNTKTEDKSEKDPKVEAPAVESNQPEQQQKTIEENSEAINPIQEQEKGDSGASKLEGETAVTTDIQTPAQPILQEPQEQQEQQEIQEPEVNTTVPEAKDDEKINDEPKKDSEGDVVVE